MIVDCKSWWKAWRRRRISGGSSVALQLEQVSHLIPCLYDSEEFARRFERLGTRRMRRLARLNVKAKLPAYPSILGNLRGRAKFLGR